MSETAVVEIRQQGHGGSALALPRLNLRRCQSQGRGEHQVLEEIARSDELPSPPTATGCCVSVRRLGSGPIPQFEQFCKACLG